jgi:hypothetical protein
MCNSEYQDPTTEIRNADTKELRNMSPTGIPVIPKFMKIGELFSDYFVARRKGRMQRIM